MDGLPDHLVIVAREHWGNTDFMEFARQSEGLGVMVHFIGYPPFRDFNYIPNLYPIPPSNPIVFSAKALTICRRLFAQYSSNIFAIHVRYYKFCSILGMLINRKSAIDIRSGSIRPSHIARKFDNLLIRAEARAFDRTTIVSHSLAKLLGIADAAELPLGAPSQFLAIPRTKKIETSGLRFVYVGTLRQRELHVFASAFAGFVLEQGLDWQFDLYGYGSTADIDAIEQIGNRCGFVKFRGYLSRADLPNILAGADVGVSYVPLTPYFDHQPPTKTFEYVMAGLPTIATRTCANQDIMTSEFGWLCDDTESGIKDALKNVLVSYPEKPFNRTAFRERTWEAIFRRNYRKEVLDRCFWDSLGRKKR
jgi:glycosyltransferase involved in cell wall biosynthesis